MKWFNCFKVSILPSTLSHFLGNVSYSFTSFYCSCHGCLREATGYATDLRRASWQRLSILRVARGLTLSAGYNATAEGFTTFIKHRANICENDCAPLKAMASAPPQETSAFVGHPPLPSYEEALGSNPQSRPMPYAPADMKTSVPPYPTQAYSPVYPPPPQQGQPVTSPVVSVQTVYVQPGLVFGNVPVQAHCPVCAQNVITRLEYTSGALAWLSCAGLAIFGCIYGCCLIPFCVDSLKDVTHHCPNCSSALGVYRRM